jgi:hypothetical protein
MEQRQTPGPRVWVVVLRAQGETFQVRRYTRAEDGSISVRLVADRLDAAQAMQGAREEECRIAREVGA